MPTIPNQQSANDSVIVRVPVPQPVQNIQRKPRQQPEQPQQNSQQSTFKKTTTNTPQSIILPYYPVVGNEQKTAGNNNAATQYDRSDAPNLNYSRIRRKLKNILKWRKITLSNPGLCTYSKEKPQTFLRGMSHEEFEHLKQTGILQHGNHPGNRFTTEPETAQYYASDKVLEDPGIVAKFEIHPDDLQHVIQDEITPEDYKTSKPVRILNLQKYARKINYNKEKAPTGGIINRGMYFPGGSFIPDMPSGLPNDNSSLPTSEEQQPQVSKKKKLLTDIKDILKSHKSQLPINDKVLYEKYRSKSYVPRKDEQWYDEDWHTVTSSNVQSVAYNPTFKRLYVEFKRKKGGHSVYQYENVPDDIHDALMQASSKGKFVYYVLRNHGTDSDYAYRQID